MTEGNKMPVTVYQVDRFPFPGLSFEQIIDEIIEETARKGDKYKYRLELLKPYDKGKFTIRLYSAFRKDPPTWVKFLKPILDDDSRLFKANNSTTSFVCFIEYNGHIYAYTGGQGHTVLKKYVYEQFGLELLIKLVERDSKVIKEIQDRGVTGIVLGQTKFYRGDQRFADETDFGKIFKSVKAELNADILTNAFRLSETQLNRDVVHCLAKDTFRLGTSVDFETLLFLTERFDAIQILPEKFAINKVKLISRRHKQNIEMIDKLNYAFMDYIYEECKSGDLPDVDFCEADFESFMTADRYMLHVNSDDVKPFASRIALKEIIKTLKEKGAYHDDSFEEFKHTVLFRVVSTSDVAGHEATRNSIWNHLHGELSFEEKSYFRVDCDWYHIDSTFINDLNQECARVINDHWHDKLALNEFDINIDEGAYNRSHLGHAQTIVLDTITPENIECCDLMIYESDTIYLVHVKKGFDNSVRDLASQVRIAAKRLEEDLRTGYLYIDKLQDSLGNCGDGNPLKTQRMKAGHLKELFGKVRPSNIIFCFAIVDKRDSDRALNGDLNKFRSNIAKYSLIELRKQILGLGFGFRIVQLKRGPAEKIKKH